MTTTDRTPDPKFTFRAEMGHWSSVVGNSVHLIAEDGRMIGQIAFLCHSDEMHEKDVQTSLATTICLAINGDASAEPQALVAAAIEPVLHWYQSDEHPARPLHEVIADIVADLQEDRAEVLKARAEGLRERVTVKPLTWEGGVTRTMDDERYCAEAKDAFGNWYTVEDCPKGYRVSCGSDEGWSQGPFDDPDSAKAAGDARNESNILSALSDAPVPADALAEGGAS